MIDLKKAIDRVIYNMTVKAMLDPENEYFYIPRLTLQKVEVLCDNDDDKTEMFWLCYKHASRQYNKQQEIDRLKELDEIAGLRTSELDKLYHLEESFDTVCPECGCTYYIDGCSCPNCDYKK